MSVRRPLSVNASNSAARRPALREQLRHHVSRIAHRCTVPELAKAESRTALSLRLVLFADALDTAGMLGSIDELQSSEAERHVRNCLKPAFRGDVKQVERALTDVARLPLAVQQEICELLAVVGWRLFDGPATPESRAV